MFTYYVSRFVGNVAGYLYPAYLSYKAVKARDAQALDRWLVHWIVMSIFTILEIAGDTLLFWVPLYYELKLIIVLWLVLPYTQGSLYLYIHFLQPTLAKHEQQIDNAMWEAQEAARLWIVRWGQAAFASIRNTVVQAILSGNLAFIGQHAAAPAAAPPKQPASSRITEVVDESEDDDSTDASTPRSVVRPRAPREQVRPSPRKRLVRRSSRASVSRTRLSGSIRRNNPDLSMDFSDEEI